MPIAALAFLGANGCNILASNEELFALNLGRKEITERAAIAWFETHAS